MSYISIIIPTYNRGHLISRAIESIIIQTFTDWELIIVDDGSSDNTSDIVEKYLKDNRIKYIYKANSGAAHSRNVGVENAKSDIITFLDSDDEADPQWLSRMMGKLIEENSDIVCCGLSRFDSEGKLIDTILPEKMGKLFNGITGKFTNGGSFMLKKHIFKVIGGYDNELRSGQHTELAIRLVSYMEKKPLRISNIYEPLLKINIHKGARIRTDYKGVFEGTLRIIEKHEERLKLQKSNYNVYLRIAIINGFRSKNDQKARLLLKRLMYEFWYDYKTWLLYFRYLIIKG